MAAAPRHIAGLGELAALVGQPLGTSSWFAVDQARIDGFADVTIDHQWIHVDPARAAREMPQGRTIAHGYLTLSLIPHLRSQAFEIAGIATALNYGLRRVRFPAPVPAGTEVRAGFKLLAVQTRAPGQALVTTEATVEARGQTRPVCVAELLALLIE
jgi:acyl dehydratase